MPKNDCRNWRTEALQEEQMSGEKRTKRRYRGKRPVQAVFFVLLLLSLVVLGCGRPNSPEGVAEAFVRAIYKRSFDEAADYVGPTVRLLFAADFPGMHEKLKEVGFTGSASYTVEDYDVVVKTVSIEAQGCDWKGKLFLGNVDGTWYIIDILRW
jgi:hypothetical protein